MDVTLPQANDHKTSVRQAKSEVININYGDLKAHAFLWQKAFLLIPIWALFLVPMVALICRCFGNWALQFGFGVTLCVFTAYFCEDLLKRRIRIDDDYLFFGFRAIAIRELVNIDIKYKKSKFLPGALVLAEQSGKKLTLSLNGLTEENVRSLLKHLQARNSSLKIAAVLTALLKCRNAKATIFETARRLEIPYQSRQLVSESVETFKLTAKKWTRLGPLLVCLLASSFWLAFVSTLYISLQSNSLNIQSLNAHQFLAQVLDGFQELVVTFAGKAASPLDDLLSGKISAPILITAPIFAGGLLFYLQRSFWRPNLLIADTQGLKLAIQLRNLSIPIKTINWSIIRQISMQRSAQGNLNLRIKKENGKNFDLNLSSIASEDRGALLRRIEKFVPECQIDDQLSQSMTPSSEHSYTEIWLQSLNQSPERKTLEPLEPGQIVGQSRFEVLRCLGVGGQGTAYMCRSVLAKQPEYIVLKETILPIFVDLAARKKALDSFEQEARLLKSLDSPGIVKLIDYFVEDHRAYLVLEHISGCNLRELVLKDGPLAQEKIVDLALQMTEILQYLHSHSVVHRDFTPDNLMLNEQGKLKLLDFNVAQQMQSGATGSIVGKHAYLPPEQFRGKATIQSDLYALGATLVFLATGSDPEPISQSSLLSGHAKVSDALDRLVKKATCLSLSQRYQTAQDIAADLFAEFKEKQTNIFDSSLEVTTSG